MGVPCLTLRKNTERPVTVTQGTNTVDRRVGGICIEMAKCAEVAVIGCGYWGKNTSATLSTGLVRNFAQLGVLRMVCDATEVGRQRATELAPDCATVADPAEVWEAPVAGAVIATPAETHYDLTRQALLAGKDVLCEKPLALTYEQGAKLVRLAERQGRILMVGHVLEYHPGIVRLLELVQDGKLGKVRYIYSNRLSLGKVRREENILWSFAPHDIAIILRLMGAMPFQVVACGGSYVQPNIADVTVTHLLFDNGCGHTSTSPGCTRSRSSGWWWSALAKWPASTTWPSSWCSMISAWTCPVEYVIFQLRL